MKNRFGEPRMLDVPAMCSEASAAPIGVEGMLTPAAASKVIGQKPATLAIWRSKGFGPRFVKIGRKVWYRLADLEEWIGKQVRQSTR